LSECAGAKWQQYAVNTESNGDEAVSADLQQDQQVHRRVPDNRWCIRRCYIPGSQSR